MSDGLAASGISSVRGDNSAAQATASDGTPARANVVGDDNSASAIGGTADVKGDGNTALADGAGSLALVRGSASSASALGQDNFASVLGSQSLAIAGPGTGNTATVVGNGLVADTGAGDGNTVVVTPATPVDPDNSAPIAGTPGAQSVDAQSGVVTGTLGFTDPDGDPLTYTVIAEPTSGSVVVDGNGSYTYTPVDVLRPRPGSPDGSDTFTVTASDGRATTAATITVPVAAVPAPDNASPVANPDSYSVDEGTTLTVAGPGVLGNDTDADADPLTAALGAGPGHGTFTLNTDGSFSYTPNAGYTGTDTFTYTASDGQAVSSATTVTLTVTAASTGEPNTVVGTVTVGEDPVAVSVTPDGTRAYVLNSGNLFNQDNASVSVIDMSDPSNPAVVQTIPFDIYNPREIAVSPDGLRAYVGYDNTVGGNGHLLVIDTDPTSATYNTVIGDPIEVGDGPRDITFSPDGTRALILNQSSLDIVVLDIDPASPTFHTLIGGPIDVSNSSPSAVAVTPDGTRAYVTVPGSSFDYVTVIDIDPGSAGYGTKIGSPIAGAGSDAIAITPNGTRAYVLSAFGDSVGIIDTDPSSATFNTVLGDPIAIGDLPQSIVFSPDGTRAYVSNGFDGDVVVLDTDPASATYNTVIGDPIEVGNRPEALAISADGTYLHVVNANDDTVSVIYLGAATSTNAAPVAGPPGEQTVDRDSGEVTGTLGFTDADGDVLTYTLTTPPADGTITLGTDGSFTYTPDPDARPDAGNPDGTDTFTVSASDGQADAATIITVPVTAMPETAAVGTTVAGYQWGEPATGTDGTVYQSTYTGSGTTADP